MAQKKTDQAALVKARLDKAWARADVKLTASRFGQLRHGVETGGADGQLSQLGRTGVSVGVRSTPVAAVHGWPRQRWRHLGRDKLVPRRRGHGSFFDLFILLANPNPTNAIVEIRDLLTGGTVLTKTYTVDAESRRTSYVDAEDFPGQGQALDNVAVSCAITSTNGVPIVVERSMWFPGPAVRPAARRRRRPTC